MPEPNQDYREIRVKIRAGHPLFAEIAALRHADAADLLSTLILEGLTWQRRVGPVLEMLSKGNLAGLVQKEITVDGPRRQEDAPIASAEPKVEISGEDVLESFGLSR